MKKIVNGGEAPARRPRGRPRSFDRDAALERAMEVFWRKGFEATSIIDLTEAMGINPPSLYAAFGDKEHLYLQALERYQETRRDALVRILDEAPTARDGVERALLEAANEICKAGHPRGCMVEMSAMNCASTSPEAYAALVERRAAGRRRVKERIDRGIREGDVPPGTDSAALADFYHAVFTGMSVQARDGLPRKKLIATVEAAMRAWPTEGRAARRGPRRARGEAVQGR